ncbi:unnamed protein product [Discosporangium mesarthrocarpum]
MKTGAEAGPAPEFIKKGEASLVSPPQFDVAVCGGTLGIFAATALQMRSGQVEG